ncbi:hypothetical protein BAE44_0012517, partial [Dichanthelium oligosanthes]
HLNIDGNNETIVFNKQTFMSEPNNASLLACKKISVKLDCPLKVLPQPQVPMWALSRDGRLRQEISFSGQPMHSK